MYSFSSILWFAWLFFTKLTVRTKGGKCLPPVQGCRTAPSQGAGKAKGKLPTLAGLRWGPGPKTSVVGGSGGWAGTVKPIVVLRDLIFTFISCADTKNIAH